MLAAQRKDKVSRMTIRIALMGISGSGKDYLGSLLVENYGYKRFSFSDQLKSLARKIYPWLDQDYPPLVKENPLHIRTSTGEIIQKSPREIWLHLNFLREIENKIFIRMLEECLGDHERLHPDKRVMISDIRSRDELNWCKSNGFVVVYIYPQKRVYKDYEIDRQIIENKDLADFEFENSFNGHYEFDNFLKEKVFKR